MCSNMNAIFAVSATIYCIGFIISSNYCLGSPYLIEFVEEWSCYDSEIRLTCGHLDSKIAILEATFSPNCTQPECIKGDLKRLMRKHPASKSLSARSAETEAGRKFLETLRKSDLNSNAELVDLQSPPQAEKWSQPSPQADFLIEKKEKRASLRASLERLIVKYLRQISPSENFEEFGKRLKRFRRDFFSSSSSETETEAGSDSSSLNPNESKRKTNRVMIGAVNISSVDYPMQDRAGWSEERYRKYYETRRFCAEQSRKIGALSRLEIDESLRKVNDTKHNIRKTLNKRCSGKNHCSFLFAADDPLAVLWDSGLVHIKYVCMNDYHTNHYCNEHLTIGNDNSPKRRQVTQEPGKGEPVAEARIQPRDQITLHSVKILKTSDDDVETVPSVAEELSNQRKAAKLQKARKKEKGIYSQDFKVLKILPSNLDDFNDIEEIGDEIYFRTDEASNSKEIFPSVLVPTALTLASEPSSLKPSILPIPLSTTGYSNNLENSDRFSGNENRANDLSKFENITIIIREGEEYFVPYSKPRIPDNIIANDSSSTTTTTATTTATATIPPFLATTTPIVTSSTVLSSSSIATLKSSSPPPPPPTTMPPASIVATTIPPLPPTTEEIPASGVPPMTFVESAIDGSRVYSEIPSPEHREESELTKKVQDIETVVAPTADELSMEASNRQYSTVTNELDTYDEGVRGGGGDYDEDESLENMYYGTGVRRQYTSIQRTYYGPPKSQGFTMTPGYPKFYIGECECKWRILAPVSHKIRLIVLDISLRNEKNCRDYLQIVDMKTGKIIFKSCEEPSWPIEILSSSNQVEIVVKATTKFAYPKRGVLIHYSALGCLTPSPPMNGRFVERTDSTATFECEPSFVFPDSTASTRLLSCTDQHIWNGTVPDCVEEDAVSDSGSVPDIISLQKTQSATSAKMGHAETDTVLDIIVPSILIVGLFAINAVIFIIIMKQRKRSSSRMDAEAKELAEL